MIQLICIIFTLACSLRTPKITTAANYLSLSPSATKLCFSGNIFFYTSGTRMITVDLTTSSQLANTSMVYDFTTLNCGDNGIVFTSYNSMASCTIAFFNTIIYLASCHKYNGTFYNNNQ